MASIDATLLQVGGVLAVVIACAALGAGGCQLFISEQDGQGGSRATGTGTTGSSTKGSSGASMESTSVSTGTSCTEATAFPMGSATCGDSACSGFCDSFKAVCGSGFSDFKTVCCQACDAVTASAPGSPFCCRARLIDAAEAKPSVCTQVPLGDGTPECASPQRNFCAIALKACTNLTEPECTGAKSTVTSCLGSALKALANPTECVNLIDCIANN
ncbi:MAG: hypothetical protein U0414_21355 [Polyangiaceae bacterium]